MKRYFGFSILGAVAVALASAVVTSGQHAATQESGGPRATTQNGTKLDVTRLDVAMVCSACQRECDMCATYCLQMIGGGHADHLTTAQTCRDCADFCAVTAQFVSRSGPFQLQMTSACAEACRLCAEACEKSGDATMQDCATQCKLCQQKCEELVNVLRQREG
jgi:hypothetical protein